MATESIEVEVEAAPSPVPLQVTLNGRLPLTGQVTDVIQCTPSTVSMDRGHYEMVLKLDDLTVPADMQFHPLEPLVWLQVPRPAPFGPAQLDEAGRVCTFFFKNEQKEDTGRFEFLLRLVEGGQVYLSQDPTIYNKPDQPFQSIFSALAEWLVDAWRSLVGRAGGRTRAGRTSGLPALR
jgi:hypothetical protein